ncbi:MAG TPA: DsbA family oxidoreductase [Acidimicrobiales bacterium]
MRIDVWSDIVCPWCYVGEARLANAIAAFPQRAEVEVVFRSFELDPTWTGTEPVLDMLATKYGMTTAQAAEAEERVAGLARAEGLPYKSGRLRGNSFDAHRLIHLAADRGLGRRLVDLLFRSHFGQAASVFEADELLAFAVEAGLDRAEAKAVLEGDDYADEVRADEAAAHQLGVRGVPFFVFDGAFAVSGAQSAEVFTQALTKAWDEREVAEVVELAVPAPDPDVEVCEIPSRETAAD